MILALRAVGDYKHPQPELPRWCSESPGKEGQAASTAEWPGPCQAVLPPPPLLRGKRAEENLVRQGGKAVRQEESRRF